ncbi:cystathionine beta-lyase [Capronia epimyces CBS 606.96]|uniref:Cystathionine beta-lyase n=1 Tax=Capronia epimyces CBS 606.96 TaxID=1182542 RepID=W9Y3N0_9EURO|nr:cystathionine beta-lyase [Capronia epimyces CBS 606.96]EXJ87397.1 cystathionine beta-lyase [Capronia epimyces CBS 606.96]
MATNGVHQPTVDADDVDKVPGAAGGVDAHTIEDSHALDIKSLSAATQAIHADDPLNVVDDVAPPIHVSTTFRYNQDPSQLRPWAERGEPAFQPTEHLYSRHTTHSSSRLEAILGVLLHNPCLTYSSGLSAFNALITFLNPKRVAIGAGYHGCHGVLGLHQKLSGLKLLPLDCKPEDLHQGDLLHLETPINPTGEAFDIQHYADLAHSKGAYLSVDATFAPPPLQDPFKHGADIVMHSGTKYIGGHSDMLCGVLAVKNKEWIPKMVEERLFLGSVMGGLEAWLGVRSVRTLELRLLKQSTGAQRLVDALDGALTGRTVGTGLSRADVDIIKSVVSKVYHASLQTEDYKTWLKRQMPNGFGPVFSISLKSADLARALPSKLHLFHHATSLGGVESLIEWRTMSDSTVGRDLLRISVGIEDDRDLLDDLIQGFRAIRQEIKE